MVRKVGIEKCIMLWDFQIGLNPRPQTSNTALLKIFSYQRNADKSISLEFHAAINNMLTSLKLIPMPQLPVAKLSSLHVFQPDLFLVFNNLTQAPMQVFQDSSFRVLLFQHFFNFILVQRELLNSLLSVQTRPDREIFGSVCDLPEVRFLYGC